MLSSVLQGLATAGRTVVLTTHNLEQGLEMCDRAVILNRGQLAWEGLRPGLELATIREIYRAATNQGIVRYAQKGTGPEEGHQ
jgi:ABC-type multidrug transport system ATPase subunit